ncbi:MAG: hypothetical protein LBT27_03490, partial [Prevotellaceae bacterium]|nr:hypothetical protein [Prevotellaceae bacterium]
MKKIILICLMAMFTGKMSAQTNVDSLINVLETQKLTAKEQLDVLIELCDVYKDSNIEKLMIFSKKGLQLAQKENDKVMTADFYRYVGCGYDLYGDKDTAVIYYEKGLELAVEIKYKKCEALLYKDLGYLNVISGQYNDSNIAMEYYLKALQIFESIDDKKNIALTLNSISGYHKYLRNTERAYYYIKRAKKLAEEINYDYAKVGIYYNLGQINEYVDESIIYDLKSLEIARNIGHKRGQIMALQSLAYIYCLDKEENDIAEKYADECLQIAEEYGQRYSCIAAWTVLSYVYLYQKRYDDCKTMVLKAWEADSVNVQISTLTNLAAAYLYSGELDKAHDFFVKYVYLIEEMSSKKFQKNMAEMETKYETEKKELRITALEKEKTWIIIVSIIAVLFVLSVLYYRNKLNKNKIKQLEQEKLLVASQAVIDGETSERVRLSRDLHDG